MSRHTKFEADEAVERMTAAFDSALAGLDALIAETPAALADFDRLVGAVTA